MLRHSGMLEQMKEDNQPVKPRQVTQAAATKLISDLSNLPSEKVDVVSLMSDPESFDLAVVLEDIPKQAGWQSSGVSQVLFYGMPKGVIIETLLKNLVFKSLAIG